MTLMTRLMTALRRRRALYAEGRRDGEAKARTGSLMVNTKRNLMIPRGEPDYRRGYVDGFRQATARYGMQVKPVRGGLSLGF